MKIPELVYEIRNLARKDEDPVKKDLFYQCAKAMEILGNLAKISDLAVAEYKDAEKNDEEKNKETYPVSEITLQMLDEHLDALLWYKFISPDDRWPYGNKEMIKFIPKYLKSHIVKDSSIE